MGPITGGTASLIRAPTRYVDFVVVDDVDCYGRCGGGGRVGVSGRAQDGGGNIRAGAFRQGGTGRA
jgi:hypothetical protein